MVNEIQRRKVLRRIPLVMAILFAVFWGGWYLINGEIPVFTEIEWNEKQLLPFPISRLWDIPVAFVWSFISVFLFTHKKIEEKDDFSFNGLFFALIFGQFFALIFGLAFGLALGLAVSLPLVLFFILLFGPVVSCLVFLLFGIFLLTYKIGKFLVFSWKWLGGVSEEEY